MKALSQVWRHALSSCAPPLRRHARSLVRGVTHRRFASRTITTRYGDFELSIQLIDEKGAKWYDHDRDFEPEIQLLRSTRLKPGALVFDLGAHQGVVATALAKLVEPHGRVIALEANARDAAAARRNAELNGCHNLAILNEAVSDCCGELEFETKGRVSTGDSEEPTVTVPARTIDSLAQEYGSPDVIFIDVDGFEMHALHGAQRALSSRPDCYVEVHGPLLSHYGVGAMDVLDTLSRYSYELFVSSEMRPSRRRFRPWPEQTVDPRAYFHVVALGHHLHRGD